MLEQKLKSDGVVEGVHAAQCMTLTLKEAAEV
jgi:hypothetical protein